MAFTEFSTHQNTENFDGTPSKGGDDGYTFTLEELSGFDPDDNFYTDPINKLLFGRLKKIDKERDEAERRHRRQMKYAIFADALKTFSETFDKARYGETSSKPSFSGKLQERYDKMQSLRENAEGRLLNFYNRYNKKSSGSERSRGTTRSFGGRLFGNNYDNRQDYARAVYRYASEHGISTFDGETPVGGTYRERIVPLDELASRVQSYWESFDRNPVGY